MTTVDTVIESGQEKANERAPLGRPREFEADEVVEALVQLFWAQGYEATSLTDIMGATGLSKSSLYNTFGSKDELFEVALTRYVDCRLAMITETVVNGTRGLEDIEMLLDALWAEVEVGHDHRGCLAVNTSTELGGRDERVASVSERYRRELRSALLAAFERAAERGEVDRALIEQYADVMVAFLLGTAVIVRSGASDDEIETQLQAARAILEGWRQV